MQVRDAIISGSLGQAIFIHDDDWHILDAEQEAPRPASSNDIYLFHHIAREVSLAHDEMLPVSFEFLRQKLNREVNLFSALDGLLVGMDRDFTDKMRHRSILRAQYLLSVDKDLARRARERFLIPTNTQEWDPRGALAIARDGRAELAAACYEPLADGIIDFLADDIAFAIGGKVRNRR